MKTLIQRLQRIAKANKVEFEFRFNIRIRSGGKIEFQFEAFESFSGNDFISGFGSTPEEAVFDAEKWISKSCGDFGYKEVK